MDSFIFEEALFNTFEMPEDLDDALSLNVDEFFQTLSSSDKTFSVDDATLGDQMELDVVPFDAINHGRRKSTSASTKRSVKRTVCPVPGCGRPVQQKVYDRHMQAVHKQGPTYPCVECGRQYPRKDTLKRHVDEKHTDGEDKVECTICGLSVGRRTLVSHYNSRNCRNIKLRNQAALSNCNNMPPSEFSRMSSAIVHQSQGDFRLLRGLGIEWVCNPLIISSNFLIKVKVIRLWSRTNENAKRAESEWRPELAQLHGLAIRTVLRSFDGGEVSDELKAAMMLLDKADHKYHKHIDKGVHSAKKPSGVTLSHECFQKLVDAACDFYKKPAWSPDTNVRFELIEWFGRPRITDSMALEY